MPSSRLANMPVKEPWTLWSGWFAGAQMLVNSAESAMSSILTIGADKSAADRGQHRQASGAATTLEPVSLSRARISATKQAFYRAASARTPNAGAHAQMSEHATKHFLIEIAHVGGPDGLLDAAEVVQPSGQFPNWQTA